MARHIGERNHIYRYELLQAPAPGEGRARTGDREADTTVGAGTGGAVVSLVDRATEHTLLRRAGSRTAAAVGAAMTGLPVPHRDAVHTITADSGREFADHARVSRAPGAGFLFARPYHSWERGLNEHTNGLVRGYLPRGTDFRKVTDAEVRAVQERTDARPGKALGYLTPDGAFRRARPP